MNKPRLKGLGRGLAALLAANHEEETDKGELQSLPTIALQPGKYQPRTRMDPGSLEELAASLKAQGVMQPIMVRPVGEARTENLPSILRVDSPSMPRSRMKPRITPPSSLAHTTMMSAIGACVIHSLVPESR